MKILLILFFTINVFAKHTSELSISTTNTTEMYQGKHESKWELLKNVYRVKGKFKLIKTQEEENEKYWSIATRYERVFSYTINFYSDVEVEKKDLLQRNYGLGGKYFFYGDGFGEVGYQLMEDKSFVRLFLELSTSFTEVLKVTVNYEYLFGKEYLTQFELYLVSKISKDVAFKSSYSEKFQITQWNKQFELALLLDF